MNGYEETIPFTRVYKIEVSPSAIGVLWATSYMEDVDFRVRVAYQAARDVFVLSGTSGDFLDLLGSLDNVAALTGATRFTTFADLISESLDIADVERALTAIWN